MDTDFVFAHFETSLPLRKSCGSTGMALESGIWLHHLGARWPGHDRDSYDDRRFSKCTLLYDSKAFLCKACSWHDWNRFQLNFIITDEEPYVALMSVHPGKICHDDTYKLQAIVVRWQHAPIFSIMYCISVAFMCYTDIRHQNYVQCVLTYISDAASLGVSFHSIWNAFVHSTVQNQFHDSGMLSVGLWVLFTIEVENIKVLDEEDWSTPSLYDPCLSHRNPHSKYR